jgi:hypothetical protein
MNDIPDDYAPAIHPGRRNEAGRRTSGASPFQIRFPHD